MPAFRDVSHVQSTTTSLTGTDPTGATTDDLLIGVLYRETDNSTNPVTTVPSGWSSTFNGSSISQSSTEAGREFNVQAYWIKRGASAPAYGWSWSTSCFGEIVIAAFSGQLLTGDPFSFGTSALRNDATASTFPDVSGTTTDAGELLLWVGANFVGASGGTTPPSSPTMAERWDMLTFGGDTSGADFTQTSAGATGTVTGASWTTSPNAAGVSLLLGIRPGSTPASPDPWVRPQLNVYRM